MPERPGPRDGDRVPLLPAKVDGGVRPQGVAEVVGAGGGVGEEAGGPSSRRHLEGEVLFSGPIRRPEGRLPLAEGAGDGAHRARALRDKH